MEPCCQQRLEQMSAALDGELSPPERRELDRHLAACPDCAQVFDLLSRQSQALRALDVSAPEGLTHSILSRLPRQTPAPRPRRRWAGPALCAALLLAVGLPAAVRLLPEMGRSGSSAAPEAAMAQSLHNTAEAAPETANPRTTGGGSEPAEAGAPMLMPADLLTADAIAADAILTLSAPPAEELAQWDSLPGGVLDDGGCYRLVDAKLLNRVLDWAGNTSGLSASLTGTTDRADGVYAIVWKIP